MRRGEGKGSDTKKEWCDPLDNSPMLAGLNDWLQGAAEYHSITRAHANLYSRPDIASIVAPHSKARLYLCSRSPTNDLRIYDFNFIDISKNILHCILSHIIRCIYYLIVLILITFSQSFNKDMNDDDDDDWWWWLISVNVIGFKIQNIFWILVPTRS